MKIRVAALGLSAGLVWGCAPPDIIPATPPGVEIPKPELTQEEQSEALGEGAVKGETRSRTSSSPTLVKADNPPTAIGEEKTTEKGLKYETLKAGDGSVAKSGLRVSVHYVGRLTNGKQFDSSRERKQPLSFLLGGGNVIRGWDEGVAGMKIGEVRKLTIPPDLGYGQRGKDNTIPPNATLVFEIELLTVE
jgi:FKBP-type peptidyl-prolyl cis-trans isomerase